MRYIDYYNSPLGAMTMESDGISLRGLWFDGQKYFALSAERTEMKLPIFDRTKEWLDIYFSGREPLFTPKVSFEASPFRLAVWGILAGVPYGETVTYGDMAKALSIHRGGQKISARAVGGAVAHNPVSLIVPCHRVIGGRGKLTGYAGGIDRKKVLLDTEAGRISL